MLKKSTFGINCLFTACLIFTVSESYSQRISAGYFRSFAVCANGNVSSVGNNLYGALGDSTQTERLSPVVVKHLGGAKVIASGTLHTVALKNDGTVWAWGNNSFNQLGDSTSLQRLTPVKVKNMSNITQVAIRTALNSTASATYGLKNDGTVWSVGSNELGQFGILGTMGVVQHPALSGITAIAAGGNNSFLALKNDGTIWNGKTKITTISDVAYVACGSEHNLVVKKDGSIWAWGKNSSGELGDSTTTNRTTPVQVKHISDVIAVKGGSGFSIALKSDGTVWAWGSNATKQLGLTLNIYRTPVQVPGLTNIVEISAGHSHTMAVKNDGTIYVWGGNSAGQLGNNTKTDQTTAFTPTLACGGIITGFNTMAYINGFEIYPNPAVSNFVIDLSGIKISDYKVEIMNIAGVKSEVSYEISGDKLLIEPVSLKAGLYTVLITDAYKTYTKRLVIE